MRRELLETITAAADAAQVLTIADESLESITAAADAAQVPTSDKVPIRASKVTSDESIFRVGDKVWAKHKKVFYPAYVAGPDDLNAKQKKCKLQKGELFIWWYGEENISKVKESTLDSLGVDEIDKARAKYSDEVQRRYNLAIGNALV